MKRVKFLILIGISALLFACGKGGESEGDETTEAEIAAPSGIVRLDGEQQVLGGLKVEPVQVRSLPQSITVPGRIDFNQRRLAHLTSRVAGRVEEVHAFLGDRVQENALLATIYSQEYLTAQSEFIQAEERLKQAGDRGDSIDLATTQAIYESARSKLLVIGASENDLEEIERTHVTKIHLEIRAPFAGTITGTNVISGNFLEVGTSLFHLADLSTLWVIVDIYEKDLPKVKPGVQAEVEVAAYPMEKFRGLLTTVFDVLDEKTRTLRARVEVQNPGGRLKPQMYATVTIRTGALTDVVAVPSQALQSEGEARLVFVALDGSSFAKRLVKPGSQLDGWVEIIDGLKPGERVVTDGAFVLKSELAKSTLGEE